jgi:hypothetical protein
VIFTGAAGADRFTVANSQLNKLTANMGSTAEPDTVSLQSATASEAEINLGPGNDRLDLVSDVSIKSKTILNGGPGSRDKLTLGPKASLAGRSIRGFEVRGS